MEFRRVLFRSNEARQQMEARNRELERALGDRDQHIYSLQERLAQLEQEMAFLKAQRDEAQQAAQLAMSRAEQAEVGLKAQTEQVQTLRNKLHQAEQQLAMVTLNELELLLGHDSMNLLQEAEQAAEVDAQVLASVPASLAEAERILLEIDQFILACSEPMKSQAA